jgi:uncharacterized membrane protein
MLFAMRILSVGHAVFAAVLIGFGILGLVYGDFTALWTPVADDLPGHAVLAYLCSAVLIATGAGLLSRRFGGPAAGVLLVYLLLWMLLFRVRDIVAEPGEFGSWDGCAESLAIVAAVWALYARLAIPRFATGDTGVLIARRLWGIPMIPFGLAHFIYPDQTVVLIPDYLPAHLALAYFTGAAFLAAGVAIIVGVCARLAASLSALMIGLFTVLVWPSHVIAGDLNDFQWGEVALSIALTAAGWVVADSYRGMPWLASKRA